MAAEPHSERAMTPIDRIKSYHAQLTERRRDFHAHPELGFEEQRTVRHRGEGT
jgi:metal-dependent amidase/aminoacylase/carboxypeptidase family protein